MSQSPRRCLSYLKKNQSVQIEIYLTLISATIRQCEQYLYAIGQNPITSKYIEGYSPFIGELNADLDFLLEIRRTGKIIPPTEWEKISKDIVMVINIVEEAIRHKLIY